MAIGAILGDSDRNAMQWSRAISELSLLADALSDEPAVQQTPVAVRLNVVYVVDGRILPNEFDGVRTGSFFKARQVLAVQAAVPRLPTDDPRSTLLDLLDDVIEEAARHAVRRRLPETFDAARLLARRLRETP